MKEDIVDTHLWDDNKEFSHSFGAYFPLPMLGFGIVMILGGLYMLFTFNLFGILFILAGIVLVFAKKVTTIHFSSAKYKESFQLFKFSWGEWVSLPQCEYISVFSAVESQVINARSQTTTLSNSVIFVNLIHSRNQRLSVFKTDNLEKAFEVAHLFAGKLSLDIYDASSRDKKWITGDHQKD